MNRPYRHGIGDLVGEPGLGAVRRAFQERRESARILGAQVNHLHALWMAAPSLIKVGLEDVKLRCFLRSHKGARAVLREPCLGRTVYRRKIFPHSGHPLSRSSGYDVNNRNTVLATNGDPQFLSIPAEGRFVRLASYDDA